jgi:TRAP-type uncharacterized transport system substrate-binding protein
VSRILVLLALIGLAVWVDSYKAKTALCAGACAAQTVWSIATGQIAGLAIAAALGLATAYCAHRWLDEDRV